MSEWDVNTPEGLALAKEWLTQHLSNLSDRATWIVPRSGSIINIDKTNKVVTILSLIPDESLAKVFVEIGWTVKDQ